MNRPRPFIEGSNLPSKVAFIFSVSKKSTTVDLTLDAPKMELDPPLFSPLCRDVIRHEIEFALSVGR